jgi:AcrR family transcriptional regulator
MTDEIPTRRTQADRTRASKEKIIHEATLLFGQRGFRGAKLADVAAAAGLTEPGLLHHFPSKEHLLMGVLAERDRLDSEWMQAQRKRKGEGFIEVASELVAHNETVPGLVSLFTILAAESVTEDHPAHEFFIGRYRETRDEFIKAIRESQARGEVRDDMDAEELAILLAAVMDGLQVQWLLDPDKVSMSRVFGTFVTLLTGR